MRVAEAGVGRMMVDDQGRQAPGKRLQGFRHPVPRGAVYDHQQIGSGIGLRAGRQLLDAIEHGGHADLAAVERHLDMPACVPQASGQRQRRPQGVAVGPDVGRHDNAP